MEMTSTDVHSLIYVPIFTDYKFSYQVSQVPNKYERENEQLCALCANYDCPAKPVPTEF